jgi:DUF1680 family protein
VGYNMLKLSRHVFGWTTDPRVMDYYERVLFNTRLGTQDAQGLKMYYLPLAAGTGSTSTRQSNPSGVAQERARKNSRSSPIRSTSMTRTAFM